jgi:hypothetical protein
MRSLFLAWIALALLLFGLGTLTHAGGTLEMAGYLTATDQEAEDGYFAIGSDAMMVVKPGSSLQRWLKTHKGEKVRVSLSTESR